MADDQDAGQDAEGTTTMPQELPNRQNPFSPAFVEFIPQGWAPYDTELPARLPASIAAEARRDRKSAV